jgi:hypothetical protein
LEILDVDPTYRLITYFWNKAEYSIKTWQGLGRKVRLRRKPRRDVVFYTPLLAFRKAQRGRVKIRIEEIIEHPRPSQQEIRALGLHAI